MTADVPAGRPVAPGGDADGPEPGDVASGGVEVVSADGRTLVRFWGAVDLAVREAAGPGLAGLPADGGPLAVDCRDVTFMDSTGLSVLVRVVRDAAAPGRDVHYLGAPEGVADLLATTGVDRWMDSLGVRGPDGGTPAADRGPQAPASRSPRSASRSRTSSGAS